MRTPGQQQLAMGEGGGGAASGYLWLWLDLLGDLITLATFGHFGIFVSG